MGSFTISGLCVLLHIMFVGSFIYQVCEFFYISSLWVLLYIKFVGYFIYQVCGFYISCLWVLIQYQVCVFFYISGLWVLLNVIAKLWSSLNYIAYDH